MGMTVSGAWLIEQALNPIPKKGSTWHLVKIGQVVSEKLLNNIIILYISITLGE